MEYSIKELTALAHFSYIATPFPEFGVHDKYAMQRRVASYTNQNIYNVNEQQALGKPYFMSLKVQSGKEFTSFPNEPLISISLQKTIVETATVGEGRKGTVKEYICTEDYEIDIKGVIIGDGNTYPGQEVEELNKLFLKNEALDIVDNSFFELFGIEKIVLKSIKFDEMMGQESLQKYTITAVSDEPFLAELTNRNKFLTP